MSGARNTLARLLHSVSAGRISLVTDDGPVQVLQAAERPGPDGSPTIVDGVLRIAEFGFTSSPPPQSEVVLVRLWGNRTLTLALGTNHQPSRLTNLAAGDSALYDQRGAYVWLKPTGPVIDAAGQAVTVQNATTVTIVGSEKVRFQTPRLECTGDVVGNCDAAPISLVGHRHPETGTAEVGAPLPS